MGIYLYIATAIGLFIVTHSDGEWNIVKHMAAKFGKTSIYAISALCGLIPKIHNTSLQAQLMVYHEMVESKNPSMADERGNLRRKV